MKRSVFLAVIALALFSCDESRVYEKNTDFEKRVWMIGHKPEFEFNVADTAQRYNIICNVRNSLNYPFSRLFITYYLQDSIGMTFQQKLVSTMLFDPKTGDPQGTSGLGDIYDHRFPLVENHRFPYPGKHRIKLEQFMRADTLEGVLAIGVRIEHAQPAIPR